MKRLGGIWDQVVSFPNLLLAYRKARRGKGQSPDVARFALDLERELLRLQRELKSDEYLPGAYRLFTIYERKPRVIAAAPFRDRVVHHAVMNLIELPLDRTFIDDSYACRKGKGVHTAVDRYQGWSRRYAYALKMDVLQYFPSIVPITGASGATTAIASPASCAVLHAPMPRAEWTGRTLTLPFRVGSAMPAMRTRKDCGRRYSLVQFLPGEWAKRRPAGDPRRFLVQQSEEPAGGEPQQEQAGQPQQQFGVPPRPVRPRGRMPSPEPVCLRTGRAWRADVHEPVSRPRTEGSAE